MWERTFLVSLVTMCIANTLTQEELFAGLRRAAEARSKWLGKLVECPYCVSHWLAFGLVPLFGVRLLEVPHDWGGVSAGLELFFKHNK
jgi:hypothetical protein